MHCQRKWVTGENVRPLGILKVGEKSLEFANTHSELNKSVLKIMYTV